MNKFFLFCLLWASSSALGDATTWSNSSANSPQTAYLWSDAANWKDGKVGAAGDSVDLSASGKVYIRKDTQDAPSLLKGNGKAVLLGDVVLRQTESSRPQLGNVGSLYGQITFESGIHKSPTLCYVENGVNVCGKAIYGGNFDNRIVLSSGAVNFRFDRYALAAGEERTGDFEDFNYFGIGNGTATFYAPQGSEAAKSTWKLEKGSPYAFRQSEEAHTLAVGTAVECGGYLEDGVFLRRVFDDGTIELSAPALETGNAELSFAAFTPNFTVTLRNRFVFQGGSGILVVSKKRAEDSAKIVFNEIYGWYKPTKSSIGYHNMDIQSGTFVIRKFAGDWSEGWVNLRNAHIELADNVCAGEKNPIRFDTSSCTTRLLVEEGLSSEFSKVLMFDGSVVKEGAGSLSIALDALDNSGSLQIDGGSVAIEKNEIAGDGVVRIGDVVLGDGTELKVPESGLRVKSLKNTGAVTISGGKVVVECGYDKNSVDLAGMTFCAGASLEFVLEGEGEDGALVFSPPQGEVVGHPAFWVDASNADTLEYEQREGVNYLKRWNDCREGEQMFCTNISRSATVSTGEKMSGKYVRIANCPDETDYRNTEQLVWSEPIADIRAVFLVQDPSEGGGCILGRCSWRLSNSLYSNSWGGPFYRSSSLNYALPLVVDSSSTIPAVRYGRYYLDGKSVVGRKSGYLGAFMQLVEFHANTDYAPSTGRVTCDAFGGGYNNGQSAVKGMNGGMRIAECIIYTNELSHVERVKVAQYLSKKWLGKDVYYRHFAEDSAVDADEIARSGCGVSVSSGRVATAEMIEEGSLVKSGEGTLLVNGLDGADLDVRQGSVRLLANARERFIPSGAWIHVDARESSTVDATEDGTLEKWCDLNGNGASWRNDFTAKAKLLENAIGPYPAIDLGPVNDSSQSAGLVYYGADGQVSPSYKELVGTMGAPYIKTAFAVYDSSAGGGSVFGGRGAGFPSKGLPHMHSKGDDSTLIDASLSHYTGHGITAMSNSFAKGTGVFRRNQNDVNPFVEKFLKKSELVAFAYPDGRKMANLGVYGQNGEYRGGLKYGEVIMFERMLSREEILGVEAYLAKRWLGVDTPGYGSAAGAITVGDGAELTVVGTDFSASSIGGGGRVLGDIKLADGGSIVAERLASGDFATLDVSGKVIMEGACVRLSGVLEGLQEGEYVILRSHEIAAEALTVESSSRKRFDISVDVVDNALVLKVKRKGMTLVVR